VVELPDSGTRWRCTHCGNLTRFDVVRTVRSREYWHADLAGDPAVEEITVLSEDVESVICRWCGNGDSVVTVPKAGA
jgi:hypothetical protein